MDKNYIYQIQVLLAETGMTQGELASRLGVTHATVNRWVNAHAVPHPRRRAEIERLHRSFVAYPGASEKEAILKAVKQALEFRIKNLWKQIAGHEALQNDLLLEHTYNSTAIEGTTLTKRQTEAVIFNKANLSEKSLIEHLEVVNHATVLRKILQGNFNCELSESLILEIHAELLHGIREDAGKYSKHHRAIRGIEIALTHPKDIPEEMAALVKRWNQHQKRTLKEIAVFHAEFELIHPFGDGNGRVGRLLMAIQCLQQDLPPIIIENSRKAEYYEVLEYAQRTAEGPFIRFLAEELTQTAKLLEKYRIR